jgi:hypothetical protein
LNSGDHGRSQRIRLVARASGLGGRTGWPIGARPIELSADLDGRNRGTDAPDWLWNVKKLGIKRGALSLTGKGTITGPDQVLAFKLDQTRVPLDALLELLPVTSRKSSRTCPARATCRSAWSRRARSPTAGRRTCAHAPPCRAARWHSRAARSRSISSRSTRPSRARRRPHGALRPHRPLVFRASGMARSWSDPRLKAHLEANTDLAEIARFLPLADSMALAGRAALKLDGAGPPDRRFGWSGTVVLADASARGSGSATRHGRARHARPLPGRAWRPGCRRGSAGATSRSTARSSARSSS